MYNTASKFYNNLLGICFDEYNELPDAKRNKMEHQYGPKKLFLETYDYGVWSENEKSSDTTRKSDKEESSDTTKTDEKSTYLPPMPPLKGNEEVKEGKGLKISTINKLLTWLLILLAQIKAGNNSYKLKNEIRQILLLLHQHNKNNQKRLQQFNQVIITMGKNMVVIRNPKTFYFDFD